MPDKNTKLPEEDRPELGGDVIRRHEGIGGRRRGEHTGPGSGGAGSQRRRGEHTGSTDGTGRGRGEHQGAGGLYNRDGDSGGKAGRRTPSELSGDEEAAGGLYNDDGTPQKGWRRKIAKRYWKRAAFGGGIAGLTVTGLVMFLSVAQGPLEFVHLAQLLEKFHFSSLEDAQDGRFMKAIRYIHDPTKPERTRMGIVGNIAADHLEAKLNDKVGLRSEVDSLTGKSEGYSIIRDHPDFKGLGLDEIKQVLSERGVDPSIVHEGPDGKVRFNPDRGGLNTVKRYRANTKLARGLLKGMGYSRLTTHVGSRVLGKRAGWTFHPIRVLDRAIQRAAIKGGKAAYDKLKEKLKSQFNQKEAAYEARGANERPGGKPKARETTDADGKPVDNPQGEEAAKGAEDLKEDAKKLEPTNEESKTRFSERLSTRIAGGGLALVGVACVVRNLSASIDNLRYTKVILPMMRKAGKTMSLGSQAQSGQDIDTTSLGIYKGNWLNKKNKKGKVVSTWNQAKSIQAENKVPQTGPDLPKSDQVFNKGNPFNVFDNVPVLEDACGALESTFGQIFAIATGPISYIVTGQVLKHLLPALADWLSGAPLNPVAAGAEFGNIVNYGARLSANDQFASAGARPLSHSQSLAVKDVSSSLDKQEFQSNSFAYRMFNTKDSRTLASRLIDNQNLTVPDSAASVFSGFGHLFASAFKLPAMLLSGTGIVHADSQPYSYHGLKKVGFTADELGDPRFDNPFKNTCHVVGCPKAGIHGVLENPSKASEYTDRAKKCFGVNMIKNGKKWNIDSLTQAVNFEDKHYPAKKCKSGELEWLRIRFWLLDTPTIEGYACFEKLDNQSCEDLGIGNSGSVTGGAASVAAASGNAKQLAQQILNNNKVTYSCGSSAQQDIQNAAQGKPGTAGAPINPEILKLIATVGQNHSVCVSALESYGEHHSDHSYHYTGDAVDFGSVDGVVITGRNAPALTIIHVAEQILPHGTKFGQWHDPGTGALCGPEISFPAGYSQFDDTCNHLHVQVPR